MKKLKALLLFVTVISLTSVSCKKESSQQPDLKVTKVELIQNGEVVAQGVPVHK